MQRVFAGTKKKQTFVFMPVTVLERGRGRAAFAQKVEAANGKLNYAAN